MCCKRLAENTGLKNSSSPHHRTTLSGYIFVTKACIDNQKKKLNSNISSTCPHNTANFGPLTAETSLQVQGIPANFNGFHVLASLKPNSITLASLKLVADRFEPNSITLVGSKLVRSWSQRPNSIKSWFHVKIKSFKRILF